MSELAPAETFALMQSENWKNTGKGNFLTLWVNVFNVSFHLTVCWVPLAVLCTSLGTWSSVLLTCSSRLMKQLWWHLDWLSPSCSPVLCTIFCLKLAETPHTNWLVRLHWKSTLNFTELDASELIKMKTFSCALSPDPWDSQEGGSPLGPYPPLVPGKPSPRCCLPCAFKKSKWCPSK